jgi:hypothetical protein
MRDRGLTADEAISEYKQARIRRRFPGQYFDSTLDEIERDAQRGDHYARSAIKLLFNREYDK